MSEADTSLPFWLAVLALAEQATREPLTGLYNRRYFEATLADHVAAATRYKRELSLVLFDLNDFKRINDTRGHPAGDEVLRQFANQLNSTARKADIVCRYGGDEFAVILPETNRAQAEQFVARMEGGSMAFQSFTAGIAALPVTDLVAAADAELMQKKNKR